MVWTIQYWNGSSYTVMPDAVFYQIVDELNGQFEFDFQLPNSTEYMAFVQKDQTVQLLWDGNVIFNGLLKAYTSNFTYITATCYNNTFELMQKSFITGSYANQAPSAILNAICAASGMTPGTCSPAIGTPSYISLQFNDTDCLTALQTLAATCSVNCWNSGSTINLSIKGNQSPTALTATTQSTVNFDRSKAQYTGVVIRGINAYGQAITGSAGVGSTQPVQVQAPVFSTGHTPVTQMFVEFPTNLQQGDVIVLCYYGQGSTQNVQPSISSIFSGPVSWAKLQSYEGSWDALEMWIGTVTSSTSPLIVVTTTSEATNWGIYATEYMNVTVPLIVDGKAYALNGDTDTATTGVATASQANELWVGFFANVAPPAAISGANGGFNMYGGTVPSGQTIAMAYLDKQAVSAGSASSSANFAAQSWGFGMVATLRGVGSYAGGSVIIMNERSVSDVPSLNALAASYLASMNTTNAGCPVVVDPSFGAMLNSGDIVTISNGAELGLPSGITWSIYRVTKNLSKCTVEIVPYAGAFAALIAQASSLNGILTNISQTSTQLQTLPISSDQIPAGSISGGASPISQIANNTITSINLATITGGTFETATNVGLTGGPAGVLFNSSGIYGFSGGTTQVFSLTTANGIVSALALSAINSNMGSITAGSITLNTQGFIEAGQTAWNTGTGFYLGYSNGAYKFSIGNPSTYYLTWDGSNLQYYGSLNASNLNSGIIPSNVLAKGEQPYNSNVSFSSSSYNSVSWTSGTVNFADGTSLSVNSGSIGALSNVVYYIYFDTSVGSTLQYSTSYGNCVGATRGLLAMVGGGSSNMKSAYIQPFYSMGLNINAGCIACNYLSDITANVGSLTAGTITGVKIQTSLTATENGVVINSSGLAGYGGGNKTWTISNLGYTAPGSTLSAITSNLGAITVGTISGVTAYFGTNGSVVCDTNGITIHDTTLNDPQVVFEAPNGTEDGFIGGLFDSNSNHNMILSSNGIMTVSAIGFMYLQSNGINGSIVMSGTNGINMTNYLYISGSSNRTYTGYGYLTSSGAGTNSGSSGSVPFSLITTNRIFAGQEIDTQSDSRLKDFEGYLNPVVCLNAIMDLKPLHFQWQERTGKRDGLICTGFFAQDVSKVIPEAVISFKGDYYSDEHSLNYDTLFVYGISAIQHLKTEIDGLKKQYAELEKKYLDIVSEIYNGRLEQR